eukprot:8760116-Lingulodinium_polyedra.AAC.1
MPAKPPLKSRLTRRRRRLTRRTASGGVLHPRTTSGGIWDCWGGSSCRKQHSSRAVLLPVLT